MVTNRRTGAQRLADLTYDLMTITVIAGLVFAPIIWGGKVLQPLLERVALELDGSGFDNGVTDSRVTALRRAIVGQESGGNFRAVNPHSGALGYGQVMEFNLPSWTRDALGREVAKEEFLNSPEIQLKVIDHKLNQYWQYALRASDGNEAIAVQRVAAQWYSGNPNLYTSTRPQFYNGYRYPSIADYCLSVLEQYHQQLNLKSIAS